MPIGMSKNIINDCIFKFLFNKIIQFYLFNTDSDIYFLDDPLSSVDANVGLKIFENLILNALEDKTVIFVTHQVQVSLNAFYKTVFYHKVR